jgi:hypothetical protein
MTTQAGDLWKKVVLEFLEKATVAVLLVTAEFSTQHFILEVELPYLLRKHKEGNLIIVGGGHSALADQIERAVANPRGSCFRE